MQNVKENRACGLNNILYIFVIYLFVTIALNSDLSSNRIVWWTSVGVFVASSVIMLVHNGFSVKHNKVYLAWLMGFFAVCVASLLWAEVVEYVTVTLKIMVVQYAIFFLLSASLKSRRDIEILLTILLFACVTNAIYLVVFNFDTLIFVTDEIADRLGAGTKWNANAIGMMTALAAVVLLYFFKKHKNIIRRTIYVVGIIFLTYVTFLTGSRKAFLIIIIGVFLYLPLAVNKRNRIKTIIISLVLVGLAFLLVYKIPYFYNILGWRLDAIISSFIGTGELDSSAISRSKLIAAAIETWKDNPLLGCGLDCFRKYGKIATGRDYYSHNNFVELLADLGIVGFVAYYWGFVYCLIKFWKNRHEDMSKLLFVVLIIILIMGYACVHYADFLFGIILLAVFSYISLREREKAELL